MLFDHICPQQNLLKLSFVLSNPTTALSAKFMYHFFFLSMYVFIYLAGPSLSCGMWDLGLWPGIEPGSLH